MAHAARPLTLMQAATILPIASVIYRVVLYRESLILELMGNGTPGARRAGRTKKGR
jgi:hypothetical protein